MKIGTSVRVKGTDMEGTIIRKGKTGLYQIDIKSEHSAFDRTVYGEWDLEEISK